MLDDFEQLAAEGAARVAERLEVNSWGGWESNPQSLRREISSIGASFEHDFHLVLGAVVV